MDEGSSFKGEGKSGDTFSVVNAVQLFEFADVS